MRAVAPHDARQRRLEPPLVPRAADDPLGFAIDRAEGARLFVFEPFGRIDIDSAEPEDGGHHIGAVGERRAGRGGDIEIAGSVDDDLAHDRLPAALGLADDAGDAAVLDDRARKPAVQPHIDLRLADHRVGYALEAVGIEGGGVADRLGLDVRMKVEHAPARPFAPQRGIGAALGFRRHDAEPDALHALDHLAAEAAHRDLGAVAHVVEHQHHAAGGEAAEVGVAFEKRDGEAAARAGDRRRDARRPAADNHKVGAPHDRDLACRLDDPVAIGHGRSSFKRTARGHAAEPYPCVTGITIIYARRLANLDGLPHIADLPARRRRP